VHAKNLLINNCGNWETVEAIGEGFPEFDVVPSLALVVEAVDSVDAGALVVASQKEEVLGVLDLVGQQQTDCFKGLFSSVHIISQEEVVGIWWEASILEKSE